VGDAGSVNGVDIRDYLHEKRRVWEYAKRDAEFHKTCTVSSLRMSTHIHNRFLVNKIYNGPNITAILRSSSSSASSS
jgi:hypothetical protein